MKKLFSLFMIYQPNMILGVLLNKAGYSVDKPMFYVLCLIGAISITFGNIYWENRHEI